mgnify:CR=1 FL=1
MLKDFFGYSAGFIASIMYIPQIKKMYLTKSTNDISMNMIFMLLLCSILWITYGVYLMEWPVIITDIIIFLQVFIMLCFKIYYEKLCFYNRTSNRTNGINQIITTST